MTDSEKLQLTLLTLIAVFGGGFVLWGLYEAVRGFIDHCLGHWRRIKNRRIDAAVGRDAYSFIRGVHYR